MNYTNIIYCGIHVEQSARCLLRLFEPSLSRWIYRHDTSHYLASGRHDVGFMLHKGRQRLDDATYYFIVVICGAVLSHGNSLSV